jgi:DNA replication protein DnaC
MSGERAITSDGNQQTKSMDTTQTIQQLQHFRLLGMARCYESMLSQPVQHQPEGHSMIAMLTEAENQQRINQRTVTYLRLSKMRYQVLPEQITCSPQRNLTREQLLVMCDCGFISRAENILITGATGSGKSYLACALGYQGCLMGFRVLYYSMNRFVELLASARLDGSYIRLLNTIVKMPLLILDDFGLQPMDHTVRLTIMQILEERYGTGSTIITSQLPVKSWYQYLEDPTLADYPHFFIMRTSFPLIIMNQLFTLKL